MRRSREVRTAFRSDIAAYRDEFVMERLEANKVKPLALAKYDYRGRVIKHFLGMTPARFYRLKRWFNILVLMLVI